LRNAGHKVYGLVRSEQGRRRLVENEIIPVMAQQEEVDKWRPTADFCDVIVDAIGISDHSELTLNTWISSCKARVAEGKPKSLFIWTTGCMIYGTAGVTSDHYLSEDDVPIPSETHPHGKPRYILEQKFRNAGAVVVRPGWVYGLSGGNGNALYFNQVDVKNKKVVIKGRKDKTYSWIHVNDLANAYVRICAHPESKLSGQVFNFNAKDFPTYEQILLAASKAAGIENPTVIQVAAPPEDDWLETIIKIDPIKAEKLLGWKATHAGFIQEIDLYYSAWLSAQKKN